jgi:LysR family transcriptional activator of nhaA
MEWLNYHHLLYFWVVAREGSITRASEQLGLAQPTVSGQLRELEHSVGEKLLHRVGRNLALTEMGRKVFSYADQIFKLGQELHGAVKGRTASGPMRLAVGAADVLPKLILYRLLLPVQRLSEPVRIVCREGKTDQLLGDLAVHRLDVVLSDAPADPLIKVKVYNHLLGECGLSFFGSPDLARKHGGDFPRSLHHAPMLLPTEDAAVRRALEQWLRSHDLSPQVRGEFEDSALLKLFGQAGEGFFAMPTVIEADVCRGYGVQVIGRVDSLRVRCYAITAERRLHHSAVAALSAAARENLFDAGTL